MIVDESSQGRNIRIMIMTMQHFTYAMSMLKLTQTFTQDPRSYSCNFHFTFIHLEFIFCNIFYLQTFHFHIYRVHILLFIENGEKEEVKMA